MLAASCHSRVWKSFSVVRRGQKELPSNQSRATAIWRLFIFVRLHRQEVVLAADARHFRSPGLGRNDDLIHILDGLAEKAAQHGSVSRADAVATVANERLVFQRRLHGCMSLACGRMLMGKYFLLMASYLPFLKMVSSAALTLFSNPVSPFRNATPAPAPMNLASMKGWPLTSKFLPSLVLSHSSIGNCAANTASRRPLPRSRLWSGTAA